MKKNLALKRLNKLLWTNPRVFYIIFKVWRNKLSLLGPTVLAELSESVLSVERQKVQGIFIEAGCALGGSALVIAASRKTQRPFYIYDTFTGIPAPSERDDKDAWNRYRLIIERKAHGIGNNEYYGYQRELMQSVEKNFEKFGISLVESRVHLVQGLFQDTLNIFDPVAFAHIDSDWHDSVLVCLERIEPFLAIYGQIVVDDYFYWSGCRKAVDYYFENKMDRYRFVQDQRLRVIRVR